jgi:soluble cytochrome b562
MKLPSLRELVGAGVGVGVLDQGGSDEDKNQGDEDAASDEASAGGGSSDSDHASSGGGSGGSGSSSTPPTTSGSSGGNNGKPPENDSGTKKEGKIMKVKKTELREMVRAIVRKKLTEVADRDSVPGKDGELGKYAEKFDKFIEGTIDEIDDLIKSGEEMMRENLLNHPTVGERNRALMSRVGILKGLKAKLIETLEATHRNF